MSKFIVIEGLDGAGTTTQSKILFDTLNNIKMGEQHGFITREDDGTPIEICIKTKKSDVAFVQKSVLTKEPYQDHIHDLIRKILSGDEEYQNYRNSLTFLHMADREYHIRKAIQPNLDNDLDVISDRYLPSTMAYQSENKTTHLSGLSSDSFSPEDLYKLHNISKFPKPDLTIYIKVPIDICLKRLENRSSKEIFEKKEFLESISQRYDETFEFLISLPDKEKWNVVEIDGTQTPTSIAEEIYKEYMRTSERKEYPEFIFNGGGQLPDALPSNYYLQNMELTKQPSFNEYLKSDTFCTNRRKFDLYFGDKLLANIVTSNNAIPLGIFPDRNTFTIANTEMFVENLRAKYGYDKDPSLDYRILMCISFFQRALKLYHIC